MNVNAFKCPHCGTMMSEGMGPNWSQMSDAPRGSGGSVIMLACTNCNAALGAYFIPAAPAS
jgi:hypothetical protein